MATVLTQGQASVLAMYTKAIAHRKQERAFAETLGYYDDVQYETVRIEELEAERAETLAQFMERATVNE